MEHVQILIVGAGPIGISCGIEAVRHKMSHRILEKGCITNSIFNFPTNMTFFSTSERLELGGVPFVSHGERPTRREALEYYRRVAQAWNLNIDTYDEVIDITRTGKIFHIRSRRGAKTADNVIICTGYYGIPNLLGVPGEDLPKVRHYFDEPHPYVYQNVAVIGGANSAVQVALETFRSGSRVTMLVREKELGSSVKYWLRPDIENRIAEGSINIFYQAEVVSISPEELEFRTPDGSHCIANDFVFAMTGYRPDFSFLERTGVLMTSGPDISLQYDPATLETDVPGLFVAGVICGGSNTSAWFIENAREHAFQILDAIAHR